MKRKYALAAIVFMALFPGAACRSRTDAAQSPALIAASKSLDGKSQCVAFEWEPDGTKVSMTLPVQIEGVVYRFQLDTGATANIIYSTIADRAGWSKPGDHSFQPNTFRVANTIINRPSISIFRDMKVTDIAERLVFRV